MAIPGRPERVHEQVSASRRVEERSSNMLPALVLCDRHKTCMLHLNSQHAKDLLDENHASNPHKVLCQDKD